MNTETPQSHDRNSQERISQPPSQESVRAFFAGWRGMLIGNERIVTGADVVTDIEKRDEAGNLIQVEILMQSTKPGQFVGLLFSKDYFDDWTIEETDYAQKPWKGKNENGEYCDAASVTVAKYNKETGGWERA